ncbi:phosphonate ABC transporter, permease protein PhnE [Methylococcus sp. Mc7]|uniref:phosphonate ABC transporter, permease protein PhnE n=1 Tax=Methylococcus sp. Mc7 TaxID=2860258 RepID=UPI001C52CFB9|nr:phosphonate ABC transporter, permease protein PhnE [Methylococcus sp. Mc7]QXP85089.1 phosphonate ABC transporter, permease protein PhnE [Methylococcus sp. Mc7]
MNANTLPPLPPKPRNLFPVWLALLLALMYVIVWDLEISFETLLYGLEDMAEYFGRYGSPDFSNLSRYLELMGQTLATALWGTVFALLVAFFLAPLAARNLAPHPWLYRLAREVLNFMRALPDLMLALIFVAALGLGPMPGALALGVHTAGFLGKFFAESLERVDKGTYEGVAATGANFPQLVMYAGWPSILREAAGYTLYIMDRNVRMASALGLVGAGGIGLALHDTLRLFDYGQSAALILVIMVTIVVIDHLSAWIREKLQ